MQTFRQELDFQFFSNTQRNFYEPESVDLTTRAISLGHSSIIDFPYSETIETSAANTTQISDSVSDALSASDIIVTQSDDGETATHENISYCCCSGCSSDDEINTAIYELPESTYYENGLSIPGDQTSTEVLTMGSNRQETLETVGDTDWFRLDFNAGTFQIDLIGLDHDSGNGLGALTDTVLNIYDGNGNFLFSNDDGGPGTFSSITLTAGGSGFIYVEAAAFNDAEAGDYQLSAAYAITAPPPTPGTPLEAIQGTRQIDDSAPILVYFSQAGDEYDYNGTTYTATGVNAYEQAQLESIFTTLETMVDIDFQITTDRTSADMEWGTTVLPSSSGGTLLGFFNFPSAIGGGGFGLLNNNSSAFPFWNDAPGGTLDIGGFMYGVAIHELGHGLGLGHPHDGGNGTLLMQGVSSSSDRGDFGLNSAPFTAMSYNEGWADSPSGLASSVASTGHGATFGALDIAALQAVYGANTTHASGDDVYMLFDSDATGTGAGYYTTWDTGGTDEFRYTGTKNAFIDLRDATLQYEEGGGGFMSHVAGVIAGRTIAAGVEIENATGGDGDDSLIGNYLGNTLSGGLGADVLEGLGGADAHYGGDGDDRASYANSETGVSADLVNGGLLGVALGDTYDSIEGFIGSEFADILAGDANANTLEGGAGLDLLEGRAGDDTLIGDADSAYASYQTDTARIIANLDSVDRSGVSSNQVLDGYGDTDTLVGIDHVIGSAFNDLIYGSAGNNILLGGDGDDRLLGRGGDDYIIGGAGDDTLDGQAGFDTLSYLEVTARVIVNFDENNTFLGVASNTADDGQGGLDTFTTAFEHVIGGLGNDVFYGHSGNNVLEGGAGNDALFGRGGDDTFISDAGDDRFFGQAGFDIVDYSGASGSIAVNLTAGTAMDGSGGTDELDTIERVLGSSNDDTFTGDALNNQFFGNAGVDVAHGGDGADTLLGGDDGDTLNGEDGSDRLSGENGDDILNGGNGIDIMDGGDGADLMNGGADGDRMFGRTGADTMNGDAGIDILNGQEGDDILDGGADRDFLRGNEDNDRLIGGEGNDRIDGGSETDTAVFSGASTDYTIILRSNGVLSVEDNNLADGDDGFDVITNVEFLEFTDTTIDVSGL